MTVTRGQDIELAARHLQAGRLVAFPTETVYGLGADAQNQTAIAAVFTAKGRPSNHPVIVHVADAQAVSAWADTISPQAKQLMQAFWPGPLTLVLPRHPQVSTRITGGQDTIAVRCPAHPVAQQLLRAFSSLVGPGAGVIAPSANRFGQVSPTQAEHVYHEFADLQEIDIYLLEGQASEVGIESTIIDLSQAGQAPRILRPGHVQAADIEQVLGSPVIDFAAQPQPAQALEPGNLTAHSVPPRVSGSLKAHYAPRTPLFLFSRHELKVLEQQAQVQPIAVVGCGPLPLDIAAPSVLHVLPDAPIEYAAQLYATLRELDSAHYAALWFEQPPATAAWAGVNDRLGRAAAAHQDSRPQPIED